MRIALFTSFSPEIGGGSVPLRDHLEYLSDLNICWYYLAPQTITRENCEWLGKPFSDLQLAADLVARTGFLPGSTTAARHVAQRLEGDLFWVVGHYEGVSVAAELLKLGKCVHLTVHDDPVCMFKRSRRYRPLTPLMERHFSKVVRAVKSVDVISRNLRQAYQKKYGVESFRVYRYVPELPELSEKRDESALVVGHIGSVYHPQPFRIFLKGCQGYAAEMKRSLKVIRIGSSPELDAVAAENPQLFENRGELNEAEAVRALAGCDLVYAMYPAGSRFECFRRTSQPMKLSTYIQAQRPIFAHTPPDSGLAEIVSKFRVGMVCPSDKEDGIRDCLEKFAAMKVGREQFEELREELTGVGQLEELRRALSNRV
jgi:hypothetical protein